MPAAPFHCASVDPRPLPGFRINRRPPGEPGRNLDHRLVDEHRYGVEVTGVGFQAQSLGLQGYGATAGEGIVEGREPDPD